MRRESGTVRWRIGPNASPRESGPKRCTNKGQSYRQGGRRAPARTAQKGPGRSTSTSAETCRSNAKRTCTTWTGTSPSASATGIKCKRCGGAYSLGVARRLVCPAIPAEVKLTLPEFERQVKAANPHLTKKVRKHVEPPRTLDEEVREREIEAARKGALPQPSKKIWFADQ